MLLAVATIVALVCTLGGVPQIATMLRERDSRAQSPTGWAMGAKGAASTAYLGAAKGAAFVVYAPSLVGGAVCIAGLLVVLALRR